MSAGDSPLRATRKWGLIALIALLITAAAWGQRWRYYSSSKNAAQASRFAKIESDLNQPAFTGISTEIHGLKYAVSGAQDVVHQLDAVKLDETIAFSLTPLDTIADCSANETEVIKVTLDAPAFTVHPIGEGTRSRQTLVANSCDLSPKAPLSPPPWRWNVVPTEAGHHLITLSLQAFDKSGRELNSRSIDIPMTVLAPEESMTTVIGTVGGVIAIITGLIGLWGQFGKQGSRQ
jgi:hypothetical protein